MTANTLILARDALIYALHRSGKDEGICYEQALSAIEDELVSMANSRAEFEAWSLRVLKQDAAKWKNPDGRYVYVESEWMAWQAARAQVAQGDEVDARWAGQSCAMLVNMTAEAAKVDAARLDWLIDWLEQKGLLAARRCQPPNGVVGDYYVLSAPYMVSGDSCEGYGKTPLGALDAARAQQGGQP